MDLYDADLRTVCIKVVNSLFNRVADTAHSDDDFFGIGSTVVVEELVARSEFGVDLVHVILGNADDVVIVLVASFPVLEEDVRVFG